MAGQRRDLAGVVHADLEHAVGRGLAACAPGSAARPSDCCGWQRWRGSAPAAPARWRSTSLVPVLPTLPVTPAIRPAVRSRAARPRRSQRQLRVGDHDQSRAGSRTSSGIRLTSAAGRAALERLATNVVAVAVGPTSATNRSPGASVRRVDRDAGRDPVAVGRCRRSRRDRLGRPEAAHDAVPPASRRRRAQHLGIVERQCPVADDLAGLVALAGDQQRVAGGERREGRADRLVAVADLEGAAGAGQHRRADRGRRPRCAGLSSVTMTTSASRAAISPISGRLPAIAVAAAAEHHHQPAASCAGAGPPAPSPAPRACGRSRRRPRPRWDGRADELHPAGRRPQGGQARQHGVGRAPPVASTRPAAASRLWAWKPPTSGRRNAWPPRQQLDLQLLAVRRRRPGRSSRSARPARP